MKTDLDSLFDPLAMRWKDFKLTREKITLRGKICRPDSEDPEKFQTWVIVCHGIPGGSKSPGDPGYPELAGRLCEAGYPSVIFNFRGAGESTGNFDLRGWVEDLQQVLDYVATLPPDSKRMLLFGFSAGGAVSVCTAARDGRISGLILAASPADFDRILSDPVREGFLQHARDIGIISDPDFPADPAAWAEGFRQVRPEDWIGQIKGIPVLILHGDQDETVPVAHAHRLYARANQPRELCIIKNGGHRLRLNPEAMRTALAWLKRNIP